MIINMLDERLLAIFPKKEYLRLKEAAEFHFTEIERNSSVESLSNVISLIIIWREIECLLIEERQQNQDVGYKFVSNSLPG